MAKTAYLLIVDDEITNLAILDYETVDDLENTALKLTAQYLGKTKASDIGIRTAIIKDSTGGFNGTFADRVEKIDLIIRLDKLQVY